MYVSDSFYIYLSNGDGNFQAVKMTPPFTNSSAGAIWCDPKYTSGKALMCLNTDLNQIIIGDFDGDGKTDFLSANKTSGNFDVFRSNGDGTFTWMPVPPSPGTSCPAGGCLSSTPNAVIVGDFNGDGKTDFASAGTNNVFLSNGDGSFTMASGAMLPPVCTGNVNTPGQSCLNPSLNHVIVGDFNGDGKTDFISANTSFDLWVSMGDGSFRQMTSTPPPSGCTSASQCVSTSPNDVVQGHYSQMTYLPTRECFSQPGRSYLKGPQGRIYRFNAYSYVAQGTAPFQCQLSSRAEYQAEFTCNDDNSCGQTARVIATEFQYDDFGNLSLKIEHGDTKAVGDKRTTRLTYNYNQAAYIVALPLQELVYGGEMAGGSTPLKGAGFIYDAQDDPSTPPKRGDLTQRIVSPDTDRHHEVPTYYDYDGFGNLTGIRNVNHPLERRGYDQPYNLYPVQSSTALSHSSYSPCD